MDNMFTKHPHQVGETYLQHLKFASLFGMNMMIGGLACFIHGIFPFLFEKTGSDKLISMTSNFVKRMPILDERIIDISRTIKEKTGTGS